MELLKGLNLALAFLLEVLMLAAFVYWGFQIGADTLLKILLGVGVPVIAIIIWGIYNAPRSSRRLPLASRLMLKLLMFGTAGLALNAAGQPTLAILFFLVALINLFLAYLWKQEQ